MQRSRRRSRRRRSCCFKLDDSASADFSQRLEKGEGKKRSWRLFSGFNLRRGLCLHVCLYCCCVHCRLYTQYTVAAFKSGPNWLSLAFRTTGCGAYSRTLLPSRYERNSFENDSKAQRFWIICNEINSPPGTGFSWPYASCSAKKVTRDSEKINYTVYQLLQADHSSYAVYWIEGWLTKCLVQDTLLWVLKEG